LQTRISRAEAFGASIRRTVTATRYRCSFISRCSL
jgi:hypothetical protein